MISLISWGKHPTPFAIELCTDCGINISISKYDKNAIYFSSDASPNSQTEKTDFVTNIFLSLSLQLFINNYYYYFQFSFV